MRLFRSPFKHIRSVPDGLLWAPSLAGGRLEPWSDLSMRVHLALSRLTDPGREDGRILESLVEHGYLTRTQPRGQWYGLRQVRAEGWTNGTRGEALLARSDGPLVVLDGWNRLDLRGVPRLTALVLLGDGHNACFYQPSAKSPCFDCVVRRWLGGVGAHPALSLLFGRDSRPAWGSPLSVDEQAAAVVACRERPGEALMTGIIGRIWRPFLGCPDCGECEFPERVGALWWQEHPLALVPRIQTWSGQLRLPLVAAELGETFWVLHHQVPAHGAGADFQADRARRRAVGEALERYCAIAPAAAAPLRKVGGGPSLDWPIEHVRLGPGAR